MAAKILEKAHLTCGLDGRLKAVGRQKRRTAVKYSNVPIYLCFDEFKLNLEPPTCSLFLHCLVLPPHSSAQSNNTGVTARLEWILT